MIAEASAGRQPDRARNKGGQFYTSYNDYQMSKGLGGDGTVTPPTPEFNDEGRDQAALPFFQNSLVGDLLWTAGLFGSLWLVRLAFGTRTEQAAA